MRYGIRVVALAYPCAEQWRTPRGLELVGPRYFGYDLDFQPFTPSAARRQAMHEGTVVNSPST
jgi:hypothetical protein